MSRAAWVSARASAATSCAGSLSDHPGQNSHISPSSAIAQSSQRLGSQPSLSRSQKHAVHLHIPSLLLSSRFTLEVCGRGDSASEYRLVRVRSEIPEVTSGSRELVHCTGR